MNKKIIYPTDQGVAIIAPTPDYLLTHTIEEYATKDVPVGISYKIVEDLEIPSDRTFRNAWEYKE